MVLTLVSACGGGGGGGTQPPINQPPIANAGTDFAVPANANVTLQGSGSDPEGSSVSFRWSQIGGSPAVTLTNANSAVAQFVAPAVSARAMLTFRLTVTDAAGASGFDDVIVTINPAAAALPRLRRDGNFLVDPAGRTFVARGVDYSYDTIGIIDYRVELTDADLDRFAEWGMNLLRIRLRDARAGLYAPQTPEESGYLDRLDDLIRRANARGLYVIIGMGGPDLLTGIDRHPQEPLGEVAKFFETPRRQHWLSYLERIYRRYAGWPGVIGFDPINEDIALPPEAHDAQFMGRAHADALARLRQVSPLPVYFQQTSGWVYQGRLVGVGHSLPDQNRFFCVKWAGHVQANITPEQRFAAFLQWAQQAQAPLFVCEYLLPDRDPLTVQQKLDEQRRAQNLLDQHLIGSSRFGYEPLVLGALILESREPKFWVSEWVRPYPLFVGGRPISIDYDYGVRALTMVADLNSTGETLVHIPASTYPDGFEMNVAGLSLRVEPGGTTLSASLRWDPASRRVFIPPLNGRATLTVRALGAPGSAPIVGATGGNGTVTLPVTPRIGNGALSTNLAASGNWTAQQADCMEAQLQPGGPQALSPAQWDRLRFNQPISFTEVDRIGRAALTCRS